MSLIWDGPDDDCATEYEWNLLRARVIEQGERDRDVRYQATKRWIASALGVGLVVMAAWAWWEMPW